jgi:hypothetical protein
MSNTSASAVLEHFVQQQQELDPEQQQQPSSSTSMLTDADADLGIEGYPREPGTGRLAETAGLFGRLKNAIFGDKKKKKKKKDKDDDDDDSTSAFAGGSSTAAGDENMLDLYINAAKRQQERERAATSVRTAASTANDTDMAADLDFSEDMRFANDMQARPTSPSAMRAVPEVDERIVRALAREKRDATSARSGTSARTVFDFSEEADIDREIRGESRDGRVATSARSGERASTSARTVFDFSEEANIDREIRNESRNGRASTSVRTVSTKRAEPKADERIVRALERKKRDATSVRSGTCVKTVFAASQKAEFDESLRRAMARGERASTSAKGVSMDRLARTESPARMDTKVRVPSSSSTSQRKTIPGFRMLLPPYVEKKATAVRATAMRARTVTSADDRDQAHLDMLVDTTVDDMLKIEKEKTPSDATEVVEVAEGTSGLFRGMRDMITSTIDLQPLSAAARAGLDIPLAAAIADPTISSQALGASVGNDALPNDMLKIVVDKTAASLSMTIAPHRIKTDGAMQGRHYGGLATQQLSKKAFSSSRKGVFDPARAAITFFDPLAQASTKVNVRAAATKRDALLRERAWFAALPSKKHVIVLRFGTAATGELLEDVIVFYTADASDTDALAQQDLQLAHAIVHAALRDEAVVPDSLGAAPVGSNAYAGSVALATALTQHRANTGVALDSTAASAGNRAATAQDSAVFHAFASHAQHLAEQEQRSGKAPQMSTAQAHGARLYDYISRTATASGVNDTALQKSLTQAWQALHLQATRGVPQHTARRLDNFHRASNVTAARVGAIVQDYFA